MKAITGWNFRPYSPMPQEERSFSPYICRLAPREGGFTADFIDNGAPDGRHVFYWRRRGEGEWNAVSPDHDKEIFTVSVDCDDLTDYEIFAERLDDGKRSGIRLVRTGYVPGIVINYLHPDDNEYAFSGHYLCSPSLLKLQSGKLLASMDVFAGDLAQNLTLIYSSEDDGKTWRYLTELFPCFWGKLFLSGGKLYMLGVSREYGDLLIGRSDDEGKTWTVPTVLFRGSNFSPENGLHRAPMPVCVSHGRVMTDVQYGSWAKFTFGDAIISAPEHSDLLDAGNWVSSGFWFPDDAPESKRKGVPGGIEGNVVVGPDGKVYDFLRYDNGVWLLLSFDPDEPEKKLKFEKLINLPATPSKTDILYDEKTRLYFAIVSYKLDEPRTGRNLLSLMCSENLGEWKLVRHLIDYRYEDPAKVAFQYIDFRFDGDDIIYSSRTAFNGAKNYHDNNFQTFHRIENFRGLL